MLVLLQSLHYIFSIIVASFTIFEKINRDWYIKRGEHPITVTP